MKIKQREILEIKSFQGEKFQIYGSMQIRWLSLLLLQLFESVH